MNTLSFRTRGALAAAGVAALGLLVWHAGTLRLEPGGTRLFWPALIAFAIAWLASDDAPWHAGASMTVASLIGIGAVVWAGEAVPSALGLALFVAGGALIIAIGAAVARRVVRLAPSLAAYGVGIGAAQSGGLDVDATASHVLEVWTAMLLATLLGLVAARVLSDRSAS